AALADNPQVRAALDWLSSNLAAVNETQAQLTEIAAPPFQESQRAQAVRALLESAGPAVQNDKIGNVNGGLARPAAETGQKETVVLSAHLDTVLPPGTDTKVRREGVRLLAPGISDNGTGLAALVAIARALEAARVKPSATILFVADVGEEGEGNLRGMRALIETWGEKPKAGIVRDGSAIDHVTTKALASRRLEATITGPGGHSWSDFGMPNPINALVRGSLRFINTRVPAAPRTTFNIGQIEGGTSVNSVPHQPKLKLNIP